MNYSRTTTIIDKNMKKCAKVMNKEKIDDMDYYEKYLLNATKEERDCYIKEHPDFMNEYPVSYEHRELLQDKIYRGLMRKIRDYEKSREQ